MFNSWVIDSPTAWDNGIKVKIAVLLCTSVAVAVSLNYYHTYYTRSKWEPYQRQYVLDVSDELSKAWKREWSDAEYADYDTRKQKARELLEKAIKENKDKNKRFHEELVRTVEMYREKERKETE